MKLRDLKAGDYAIAVAAALVIFAALVPTLRARAYEAATLELEADVEVLRSTAVDARRSRGTWPSPAPAGERPGGVTLPAEAALARDAYTLEWRTLQVVGYEEIEPEPPAPGTPGDVPPPDATPLFRPVVRRVGALQVHSAREELLAHLLGRYGAEDSWVRDSTWTLVLDDTTDDPTP